jgi:hypothetical protein
MQVGDMVKSEFPGTRFITGPGLHRVAPGVEEVRSCLCMYYRVLWSNTVSAIAECNSRASARMLSSAASASVISAASANTALHSMHSTA